MFLWFVITLATFCESFNRVTQIFIKRFSFGGYLIGKTAFYFIYKFVMPICYYIFIAAKPVFLPTVTSQNDGITAYPPNYTSSFKDSAISWADELSAILKPRISKMPLVLSEMIR